MKRIAIALTVLLAAAPGPAAFADGADLLNQAVFADWDEAGGLRLIEAAKGTKDSGLIEGAVLHNLVFFYDDKYIADAVKALEGVRGPGLADGLLGSAYTLKGRAALRKKDVVTAGSETQKGLRVLAQAVKSDPENLALRYVRLLDGIEVSRLSPFKQYEVIAADADFLASRLESGSGAAGAGAPATLRPAYKAAIELQLGEYWFDMKKVAKARDFWKAAVKDAPDGRSGRAAAKRLAAIGE